MKLGIYTFLIVKKKIFKTKRIFKQSRTIMIILIKKYHNKRIFCKITFYCDHTDSWLNSLQIFAVSIDRDFILPPCHALYSLYRSRVIKPNIVACINTLYYEQVIHIYIIRAV